MGKKQWGKKKNIPGAEVAVAPEWVQEAWMIPCSQKERLCLLGRSSARVQTRVLTQGAEVLLPHVVVSQNIHLNYCFFVAGEHKQRRKIII